MKIIAFIGSPRKDGNTAKIVNAICKSAKESNHDVNIYNLSNMNYTDCMACDACQSGKVKFCVIDDELTPLLSEIAKADCIILGTPIYMLQVSGITKNFLDRLRLFLTSDLTARYLPGKKYITVTSSGATAEEFSNVTTYLDKFFSYFSMESVGSIIAGNLREKDDIMEQPEILKKAEEMGRKLK